MKYYSLEKINKLNCNWNVIVGKRSNGKTSAILREMLKRYILYGFKGAYIRRNAEDIKSKTTNFAFNCIVCNDNNVNEIEQITNGEFTNVKFTKNSFVLYRIEEIDGKTVKIEDEQPFCYVLDIATHEHNKGAKYPEVKTILFDEFITRGYYLTDEFVKFCNVISTITRNNTQDLKVFLCANTISKYSPYFAEMGINIHKIKQGEIKKIIFKDNEFVNTVAVEYCEDNENKEIKKLFNFNNNKLKMITSGEWEIENYPHAPCKFDRKDYLFTFFIKFDIYDIQVNFVKINGNEFVFVHRHNLSLNENDFIFCEDYPHAKRHLHGFPKQNKIVRFFVQFWLNGKIYYSDNEIGDALKNFLQKYLF